jgi:AcrR family transcriptional regulator
MEKALNAFAPSGDPDDPKEQRRRRIVDAAKELFIRQGYRKTSIDEVAALARVAKGTVYVYAKNKADLMLQVIVEEKKKYLKELQPVLDQEQPPRDRLRWWIRTALTAHAKMPLIARLMSGDREMLDLFRDMDADLRERTFAMQRAMVAGLLEQATRPHRWTPSELEDRAKMLIGLAYAAMVFDDEHMRGGLSLERFAEVLTESLLEGLMPYYSDLQSGGVGGGTRRRGER